MSGRQELIERLQEVAQELKRRAGEYQPWRGNQMREEADDVLSAAAALEANQGLREALERLQMGPDTLTQDGLKIVLDALYPGQDPCPTCGGSGWLLDDDDAVGEKRLCPDCTKGK